MNCKSPSTWSGGGDPLARLGARKAFTAGAVASVVIACSQQAAPRLTSQSYRIREALPADSSTPSCYPRR